jgi:hypothetical protein
MKKVKSSPGNFKTVPETVFEVGAEGGNLTIYRQKDGSTDEFFLYHNEYDPLADDDATLVNVKKDYETFDQAFQYIERFPWYGLYIVYVHEDFRDFIIERLNEWIIKKSITSDPSNYNSASVIPRIQENLLRSESEWDDWRH